MNENTAWGAQPPKSLKGRIAFIKRQCVKALEDAWFLEIEGDDGNIEVMSLSPSALDKKLLEMGYDPDNCYDHRINFGREVQCGAFQTCDSTGELLHGSWSSDPESLAYSLDGFAWRRENRFQMEEDDWQEAKGYIERLEYEDSREAAKLRRLIVDSCFLDPRSVNDTGLLNPGGGGQREFSDLIALFDFMRATAPVEKDKEKAK